MSVTVVRLDDPARWAALVAGCGGPGLTTGYALGLHRSGAVPMLVEVQADGARLLFCAVEREWEGTLDVATAYGLTGAWMSRPDPRLLGRWHEHAAGSGYVAGYLQLFPGDPHAAALGGEAHNEVFVAPLGAGPPSARSRNLRAKIEAALAQGAVICPDGGALVQALVDLYPATMARVGAPALFPAATLETWAAMPGALLVGARLGERIAAVSLFLVHAGVAEYHLNVASESGRGLAALLLESAFARLPELGARSINLGGGVRPNDGLAAFKRRFGGRALPLLSVRQVYDRPRFLALCERAGTPPEGGRFPPYRFGSSPPAAAAAGDGRRA